MVFNTDENNHTALIMKQPHIKIYVDNHDDILFISIRSTVVLQDKDMGPFM